MESNKLSHKDILMDIRELIYLKAHLKKEDFRKINIFENVVSSIIDIMFYLYIPMTLVKSLNMFLINKNISNFDVFEEYLNLIFFEDITYYQFLTFNIPILDITNLTFLSLISLYVFYVYVMYKTSSTLGMLLFNIRIYDVKTFKYLTFFNVIKRSYYLFISIITLKMFFDFYNGNVMIYNIKTHSMPLMKLKDSLS